MDYKNRRPAFSLAALLLAAQVLGCGASAAQPAAVRAAINQNRIYVNDVFVGFHNSQGRTVESVSYQGTVYIPIRNVGEWMGCEVAWDQEQQAVRLTSGGTPFVLKDKDTKDYTEEEWSHFQGQMENGVEFLLRPDVKIYLDGKVQNFTNVKGEPVYPAVLDGVTYLPVRNVGEMSGMSVAWVPGIPNDGRGEIFLYTPLSAEQKSEILAYQGKINTLLERLDAALAEYTNAENLTADVALTKLETMKEIAAEMMEEPLTVPVMQGNRESVASSAYALCDGAIAHDVRLWNDGESSAYIKQETMFPVQMLTIRGAVEELQRMVTALSL